MEAIRGQIWTDWRLKAIFLPIDPTDLVFGTQGTIVSLLKYLKSNWPWRPLEVKTEQIGGHMLSFYPLTLQTWYLACKILLKAN